MKIEKISNRHIVFSDSLPEWGLNLHLIIGEKYNYIIDTGLGSQSIDPILPYLKKQQTIVINTHHHWDHVWGNHCFENNPIIAHRLCREIVDEKWEQTLKENKGYIRGTVKKCLPNLLFENELYFPDDKIRLFYTPGHTIDGISVFDEVEKVLNAGDNIGDTVDKIVPDIEDMPRYLNTLATYQRLDVKKCVSGHNVILGKDVFQRIYAALSKL